MTGGTLVGRGILSKFSRNIRTILPTSTQFGLNWCARRPSRSWMPMPAGNTSMDMKLSDCRMTGYRIFMLSPAD